MLVKELILLPREISHNLNILLLNKKFAFIKIF